MNIYINGTAYPLSQALGINITSALTLHFNKPQQSTFAVALNGDFVGKADYDNILVKNGDSLDVLQPIQGG
ncbi:sulfur carrier protein ThiS [Colwellia echini]|uniref:Sulfur carrier protein ThiS n=1 Tax=Colwellia echini TaxID=1982103 RepID=A0ABY3MZQ7_9GAMM|nr:sulfur carrier protein ThiS [Colwellia echini]TYK66564.1 sulfur carrier protein ThiS [Colwellia echini]